MSSGGSLGKHRTRTRSMCLRTRPLANWRPCCVATSSTGSALRTSQSVHPPATALPWHMQSPMLTWCEDHNGNSSRDLSFFELCYKILALKIISQRESEDFRKIPEISFSSIFIFPLQFYVINSALKKQV